MSISFEKYYAEGRRMAQQYIDGGPALGNQAMEGFDATAEDLTAKSAMNAKRSKSSIDFKKKDFTTQLTKSPTSGRKPRRSVLIALRVLRCCVVSFS